MRSDLMRELRTASIDVGSKGLSQEDANKYITERAGDFLRSNIYEPALKAKSEDFGADAPVTNLKNSFQNPVSDNHYEKGTPLDKQPK